MEKDLAVIRESHPGAVRIRYTISWVDGSRPQTVAAGLPGEVTWRDANPYYGPGGPVQIFRPGAPGYMLMRALTVRTAVLAWMRGCREDPRHPTPAVGPRLHAQVDFPPGGLVVETPAEEVAVQMVSDKVGETEPWRRGGAVIDAVAELGGMVALIDVCDAAVA